MIDNFNLYAQYYDLLYQDKDYKKEAEYLHSLIQKNNPNAKTILSLGCGTGKYEFEFEKLGYSVVGVDKSQTMIDIANQAKGESKCQFIHGDIRSIKLNRKFDVVISLFHVMCYQISNQDLLNAFNTASTHLKKGGVFLFDFWYGSAVLTDLPREKEKFVENEVLAIKRKTNPVMRYSENIVDVNFDVEILDKRNNSRTHKFSELHRMRYLFLPEITLFAEYCNIELLNSFNWETREELADNSWYGICCSRKYKKSNLRYDTK